MRDEPRHRIARRAWWWPAAAAVLTLGLAPAFAPRPALAQRADLQLDYQQLRIRGRALRPDGSSVDTTFTRSFWVQTWRGSATRRLRSTIELLAQAQYSRQAYLSGRDERTETPYGQLRLNHPAFGVSAAYKPSRLVQQVLPLGQGGGFVDTAATRRFEYRSHETIVTGYVVPERLPRLDVSWIRRQTDATVFSAGNAQDQRSARTSWSGGGVNLRAGYTDLARGLRPSSIGAPLQRTYEAGAGYGLALGSRLSVSLGYDFARFDRDPPGVFRSRSDGHTANLGAAFRQARTFDWGLGYQLRYVDQDALRRVVNRDHEGSLSASWHPRPTHGAMLGAGIRTTRYAGGERLQRYATTQATAQGTVRRGWTVSANAGESVNWDPGFPAYWTTHARVGSQLRVRTGLDLAADWQGTLNNDTLRDGRLSTSWTLGVAARPWRAFSGRASVREARVGSSLGVSGASSRSWSADARWTPVRGFDMLGAVNRTEVVDGSGSGALSRTASVQWTASPRLQVATTYTHTSSDLGNALLAATSGREVVAVRADWALFRYGSVSSGVAYVDPGTTRETRQFSASWNQRLWR